MNWSNLYIAIAIIAKAYTQGWNDHCVLTEKNNDEFIRNSICYR